MVVLKARRKFARHLHSSEISKWPVPLPWYYMHLIK